MTILTKLLFYITKLLFATYRVKWVNPELKARAREMHPQGAILISFFHEDILGCTLSHREQGPNFCPLISGSKDGEIIARIAEGYGYKPVRGSSRRGNIRALKELQNKVLKEGKSLGFPVDGPIGPRREAKLGVFQISRLSGAPVLPLVVYPEKYWAANSWDRFRVPLPFTKLIVRFGEPFVVPKETKGDGFGFFQKNLESELEKAESMAKSDLQSWSNLPLKNPIY